MLNTLIFIVSKLGFSKMSFATALKLFAGFTIIAITLFYAEQYQVIKNRLSNEQQKQRNLLSENTALVSVNRSNEQQLKKLTTLYNSEQELSKNYLKKVSLIKLTNRHVNQRLNQLEQTNAQLKNWLALDHGVDVTKLLSSAANAANKNASHHQD